MSVDNVLLKYWGEADLTYPGEPKWHSPAYYCPDVAAVACAWRESCASLRGHFAMAFSAEPDKERLCAWVLFFALHDLGKSVEVFQGRRLDASQVSRRPGRR